MHLYDTALAKSKRKTSFYNHKTEGWANFSWVSRGRGERNFPLLFITKDISSEKICPLFVVHPPSMSTPPALSWMVKKWNSPMVNQMIEDLLFFVLIYFITRIFMRKARTQPQWLQSPFSVIVQHNPVFNLDVGGETEIQKKFNKSVRYKNKQKSSMFIPFSW